MTSHEWNDDGPDVADTVIKTCPACQGDREHKIKIELRTLGTRENIQVENKEYAKEPYRIVECVYCGHSRKEELVD